MDTTQLTVHLPESDVTFLEAYAKRRNITISELIDQYIKQLQISEGYSFHPDIEKNAGVMSSDIDAKRTYYEHIVLVKKVLQHVVAMSKCELSSLYGTG